MMKKTYMTPAIDVQKFDVADVITTSVLTPTTGSVNVDAADTTIEIVAKW